MSYHMFLLHRLDGCELMGLDDKLAIAFIQNMAKQDTTTLHVILHVRINTKHMLHLCYTF